MTNRTTPVAFISTITEVREVALTGAADLLYWRDQLLGEGLVPYDDNGRASLLLTAIESKFRGIPFRELSISVRVGDGNEAFLAHAFNSSRMLAFAERVFFQTPYHLAGLTVDERMPARMGVAVGGETALSACMGLRDTPGSRIDELFEGPIFLPGGRQVFYARLSGVGEVYPFEPADVVDINPVPAEPIFARLLDSGFTGREWHVRAGAVHARSKTYERDADST